jgi:hypothetical protein
MHRCLIIPEIISHIFSSLLDVPERRYEVKTVSELMSQIPNEIEIGLATLAALARTCRSFMDPALDSLWHTQPTLANFLVATLSGLEFNIKGKHAKVRSMSEYNSALRSEPLTNRNHISRSCPVPSHSQRKHFQNTLTVSRCCTSIRRT